MNSLFRWRGWELRGGWLGDVDTFICGLGFAVDPMYGIELELLLWNLTLRFPRES